MDLTNVKIETERLDLIPITTDFANVIFQEFTPEITKYMFPQPAKNIQGVLDNIIKSMGEVKKGTCLHLVALDKTTKEFIGRMSLEDLDKNEPEMGLWLKKSAHGKGYGKEGMQAIKKWADENIQYDHILYPVVKTNTASRKIAESLGGIVKRELIKQNQKGEPLDEVEYWIYK